MRRGGYSKISGFALKELESIQTTGKPEKIAPTTRATHRPAFFARCLGTTRAGCDTAVRFCTVVAVMSVPRLLVPDLEERQDHGHEQHEQGHGRRDGEVVAAECQLV